jgi:hypothetical protein
MAVGMIQTLALANVKDVLQKRLKQATVSPLVARRGRLLGRGLDAASDGHSPSKLRANVPSPTDAGGC